MWYFFLWLSICSLNALCQNIYRPYQTNYINPFLYPRSNFNQDSRQNTGYFNKLRRNNYFGNGFYSLKQPFDLYNRISYKNTPIKPLCNFNKDRMTNTGYLLNNPEDARRNTKRQNVGFYAYPNQNYDQYAFYAPYLIVSNPYSTFKGHLSKMSDSEAKKDLHSEKEHSCKSKLIRDYEQEESTDAQLETNNTTNIKLRCSLSNTTSDELPSKFLLPSDIIIRNLGPWISKSKREVLSNNVGSLSMIYDPKNQAETFDELLVESTTLPSEQSTEQSLNSDIDIGNAEEVNAETEEIVPRRNPSKASRKSPMDSENSGHSTQVTKDFNEYDEVTEDNKLTEISESFEVSTEIPMDIEDYGEQSSTIIYQQENSKEDYDQNISLISEEVVTELVLELHKNYEDDATNAVTYSLPSAITTEKNNLNKPKFRHKVNKIKVKNKYKKSSKQRNLSKSLFGNVEPRDRGILNKMRHKNKSESNKCCFCKSAVKQLNKLTTEDSFLEEPITFRFEDYVCECHHPQTTTRKVSFFRNVLASKDTTKKQNERRKKSNMYETNKNENSPFVEYNYLGSDPDAFYDDGLERNIDQFVKVVESDGDIWDLEDDTRPGTARTKRNIKQWFRNDPSRKRKREFVSSEYFQKNDHLSKTPKNWKAHRVRSKCSLAKKNGMKRRKPERKKCGMNAEIKRCKGNVNECKPSNNTSRFPIMQKKREFVSVFDYNDGTCSSYHPSSESTAVPLKISTRLRTLMSTEVTTSSITEKDIEYVDLSKAEPTDLHIVPVTTEHSTTYPLHLVPDTGNRHPAKMACEELYGVECICYTETVIEDFNNIIRSYNDQKQLLQELTYYNCTDYRPLNAGYTLASDLKPRLITKKHKEMLVDEKNGPKEIIAETFQDLLWRGIPNEGVDFYVFPSTSIQIPCFSHNDIQLSPNLADSPKYEWKHGNNKAITEGHVIEDLNHKGMLQINDATVDDSDNYTCTVTYRNPDTEQEIRNTFVHSVMVVALPKLALHTLLHYTAPVKCDQETLEMFELYLPQQIEELICNCKSLATKVCTVEIHNPLCHGKNIKILKEGPKTVWQLRSRWIRQLGDTSEGAEENKMEMSLNYELDMSDIGGVVSGAANRTHCNPFCQLKILLKLVEIARDSLVVSLAHSVNSSIGVTFEPDLSTLNIKLLIACDGGLKLFQGFCIPCPLHTFSSEGSTECIPCPKGTYQPHAGAKSCVNCPHPFEPGCSSLWSSPRVVGIIICIVVLLLLISGLILFLIWRLISAICIKPRKRETSLKKDGKKVNYSFKKSEKKRRKSHYRQEEESTEHPPTLPSEDFSG